MLPVARLPLTPDIQGIFTDIDGTLTEGEARIPSSVFEAMERAQAAGLRVVPVTGRPAGWCDMIARTWPVDGVIGENGGLYFRLVEGEGMRRFFRQPEDERRRNRARLDQLAGDILRRVPGAGLSADQPYRELDLAIDFCEDVPALPDAAIDDIVAAFDEVGATAKVSSIHVNGWFGSHDKLGMCLTFGERELGLTPERLRRHWVFAGDSPNDEPLFQGFPLAVGVSSVERYRARMKHLPAYITQGDGAVGFVELVDRVLSGT